MRPVNDHRPTLAERRKSFELFYEFKWRSITISIDLFTKLATYFFSFVAIVFGIILTNTFDERHVEVLVYTILAVSFLYVIIACAFGYGIFRGLQQLEKTLKAYDESAFEMLKTRQFIKRGIIIGVIVSVVCVLMVVVVCGAILFKINCPAPFDVLCGPKNSSTAQTQTRKEKEEIGDRPQLSPLILTSGSPPGLAWSDASFANAADLVLESVIAQHIVTVGRCADLGDIFRVDVCRNELSIRSPPFWRCPTKAFIFEMWNDQRVGFSFCIASIT